MIPEVFDNVAEPPKNECKLVALASGRKRRCIEFFNAEEGISLRLHVSGHTPKKDSYYYCALCGQHRNLKGSNGKNLRGNRFVTMCQLCSVSFFVRVHKGMLKSSWAIWHSEKELAH